MIEYIYTGPDTPLDLRLIYPLEENPDRLLVPMQNSPPLKTPKEVLSHINWLKEFLDAHIGTIVGIAANQIRGFPDIRACAILGDDGPAVLYEPIIYEYKGEIEIGMEGCASLPGIYLPVPRYNEISGDYLIGFEDGDWGNFNFKGNSARIAQHEIDHLNGILITGRSPVTQPDLDKLRRIYENDENRKH